MLSRPLFDSDHDTFRDSVRRFYRERITPLREKWEEQGYVDRTAWKEAGNMGFLCPTVPAEYGGTGVDRRYSAILLEEQGRAGDSGPGFWVHSDIVAPYLLNYGTEEQKSKWLTLMASGDAIAAIAMSEPGAGSDLRGIRTTAECQADEIVINGSKTFISNGWIADLYVVVCKTESASSRDGISLVLVEADRPGFKRGKLLKKLGLRAQDTAELFFDNVRVPRSNVLGEIGRGFEYLTRELAWERLLMAILAIAACERAIEDVVAYTGDRKAFGKAIGEFQNTKFRLAEMTTETQIGRVFVDRCIELATTGELDATTAAMAKYWCTELQGRVLDQCLQLHGGYGFVWEYPIARAYADARIQRIAGGTNEIMREIIARAVQS